MGEWDLGTVHRSTSGAGDDGARRLCQLPLTGNKCIGSCDMAMREKEGDGDDDVGGGMNAVEILFENENERMRERETETETARERARERARESDAFVDTKGTGKAERGTREWGEASSARVGCLVGVVWWVG